MLNMSEETEIGLGSGRIYCSEDRICIVHFSIGLFDTFIYSSWIFVIARNCFTRNVTSIFFIVLLNILTFPFTLLF